jgi:hypothetical protein
MSTQKSEGCPCSCKWDEGRVPPKQIFICRWHEEKERELIRLRQQVKTLIQQLRHTSDDCEHLVNVLEGKAEQDWDYKYQREKIAAARSRIQRRRATA